MPTFAGVFTPIVTPFRDDRIDERGMRHNVERWMQTPLTGLVVLGSNGEAAQLDDDEADRTIAVVRDSVPGGKTLIAGTGRESTRATIAASARAAQLGVDAVMVRTPSFFKPQMTSDVFVRHYTAVADASPVPVFLYNVTMFTGVNLLPDAVERLSSHPNIVGIKESGSDVAQLKEFVARTPKDFVVFGGSATTYFDALRAGASGGVLALAALVPDTVVKMRELVRAERMDEARELQQRITPLARLVGTGHGVPGLKAALDLTGFVGGAPRPPLLPAPDSVIDAIRLELKVLLD